MLVNLTGIKFRFAYYKGDCKTLERGINKHHLETTGSSEYFYELRGGLIFYASSAETYGDITQGSGTKGGTKKGGDIRP